MKNEPLISICIPSYNNAKYISKTLSTLINQTYTNTEIIVCDNKSSDNTDEVVKQFSSQKMRYIKNTENVGCYNNYNECLKYAKGEYIAFYHSDDMYLPEIVEREYKVLSASDNIGAVFTLDNVINENDKYLYPGVSIPKELKDRKSYGFVDVMSCLLKYQGSFFICPTLMIKRKVFDEVGLFQVTTDLAEDTNMWLKISMHYDLGILNERLINRRISSTAGSFVYDSKRIKQADHYRVLDHFLKVSEEKGVKFPLAVLEQYEFNKFWDNVIISRNMVIQGKVDDAKKSFYKSVNLKLLGTGLRSVSNIIKLLKTMAFIIALKLNVAGTILLRKKRVNK